jgi:hypothetical protein
VIAVPAVLVFTAVRDGTAFVAAFVWQGAACKEGSRARDGAAGLSVLIAVIGSSVESSAEAGVLLVIDGAIIDYSTHVATLCPAVLSRFAVNVITAFVADNIRPCARALDLFAGAVVVACARRAVLNGRSAWRFIGTDMVNAQINCARIAINTVYVGVAACLVSGEGALTHSAHIRRSAYRVVFTQVGRDACMLRIAAHRFDLSARLAAVARLDACNALLLNARVIGIATAVSTRTSAWGGRV